MLVDWVGRVCLLCAQKASGSLRSDELRMGSNGYGAVLWASATRDTDTATDGRDRRRQLTQERTHEDAPRLVCKIVGQVRRKNGANGWLSVRAQRCGHFVNVLRRYADGRFRTEKKNIVYFVECAHDHRTDTESNKHTQN